MRFTMKLRNTSFCTVVLGSFALAPIAKSEVVQCENLEISVDSSDNALAQHICQVAEQARDQLNACHLFQAEPVQIKITEQPRLNHFDCLGVFRCEDSVVEVIRPSRIPEVLVEDDPLILISENIVFDSVIVHELTHAFAHQTLTTRSGSVAQDEYLAYAMQFEFMPEDARNVMLETRSIATDVTLDSLNEMILMFAPTLFGLRAWTHFNYENNGCEFFQLILDDKVNFAPEFE
jgi:Family of unknown function (DUF6639)